MPPLATARRLAALLALGVSLPAAAADWLAISGTAAPDAPALAPTGFVQAVAEGTLGAPVRGLDPAGPLAAGNGEPLLANTVGQGAPLAFTLRRARLGARGAAADGRVTYLATAELGQNALTRATAVALADAAVAARLLPGLSLRVGRFKLPAMDEPLENNPQVAETIDFSATATQLLLESRVRAGATDGNANAFRDTGVMAFASGQARGWHGGYAAMVSNGGPGLETDAAKDLTVRLQGGRVFAGALRDQRREELSVFVWRQQGERTPDGAAAPAPRVRQGVGAQLERTHLRARVELVDARGMIEVSPAFAGQPVTVLPTGRAGGAVALVAGRVGPAGLALRAERLTRQPGIPGETRTLDVYTASVHYEPTPKLRLFLDYAHRRASAPGAEGDPAVLAAALGDRVAAQLGLIL